MCPCLEIEGHQKVAGHLKVAVWRGPSPSNSKFFRISTRSQRSNIWSRSDISARPRSTPLGLSHSCPVGSAQGPCPRRLKKTSVSDGRQENQLRLPLTNKIPRRTCSTPLEDHHCPVGLNQGLDAERHKASDSDSQRESHTEPRRELAEPPEMMEPDLSTNSPGVRI
jgi:hypothetical protein